MLTGCFLLLWQPAVANAKSDHQAGEHEHEQGIISSQDEHNDNHNEEDHNEDNNEVHLSASQMQQAGIIVEHLKKQNFIQQLHTTGEVVNNHYSSHHLSPKITAQVIKRFVVLGQEVAKGETLVTLYSTEMAAAQSQLQVTHQEWIRVKKLGKKAVGAKRFTKARIAYEQAEAKVKAYGMSSTETKKLLSHSYQNHQLGEFNLVATQQGSVLSDNFSIGETINAGITIIELIDERTVWVEASLSPDLGLKIPPNTKVLINIQGLNFSGKVTQQAHLIDETTRTRKVRILVNNPDHILHAGLFADVYFALPLPKKVIAVPESALMRSSDGDWTVFVEQSPGTFKAKEVKIVQSVQNLKVIEGLSSHSRIAMRGAFFIASEQAKGGFDPHNH